GRAASGADAVPTRSAGRGRGSRSLVEARVAHSARARRAGSSRRAEDVRRSRRGARAQAVGARQAPAKRRSPNALLASTNRPWAEWWTPGQQRTGVLLAGGGVDHPGDRRDAVRREAAAAGVLVDDVLVGGDVDAVDLVVGDVALLPPDLRPEAREHLVRLLADGPQLVVAELPGTRQVAL